MGVTMGVGGGMKGYGQDQLLFGATAFASFEEAVGAFLGMWDYRPSFANRFFFSAQGMVAHYPSQRAYTSLSFKENVARPGSNESDEHQYGEDRGYDNWTDFKFEYVLPIGSARNDALQHYKIKGGLLQSAPVGGATWNPLKNGVTTLLLRQYNRYRSFELDEGDVDATAHPVQLALSYDNTDFPGNPSTGSSQYVGVTQDFGWLEFPDRWSFVEFEASKYFFLGSSDWAKQRIIALNLWTGETPSWEEQIDENGNITVTHRPPFYEGATLGGFYRMRGYPVDRFNDRSVLYTAVEYRYTLDWNPLGNIPWLKFLQSDWLQLVGFVEGGRVANEYGDLFKDWKLDGGVGIRSMFAGAVVRLDVGFSDESTSAWVMLGHPF
jgi:outer membrane protein assembly factor BamA